MTYLYIDINENVYSKIILRKIPGKFERKHCGHRTTVLLCKKPLYLLLKPTFITEGLATAGYISQCQCKVYLLLHHCICLLVYSQTEIHTCR